LFNLSIKLCLVDRVVLRKHLNAVDGLGTVLKNMKSSVRFVILVHRIEITFLFSRAYITAIPSSRKAQSSP